MSTPSLRSAVSWTSRAAKRALYRSPVARHHGQAKYPFLYEPEQLVFFCDCIDASRALGGPIAEVGCFRGHTTVFLAKYLSALSDTRPYYAFDTFEGFTGSDIAFEGGVRGKDRASLIAGFSVNTQAAFDKTMQMNGATNVISRRVDANEHSFSELDGCSFGLLDMDLYRPIKSALDRIYDRCAPGAILVVDDCYERENLFDGALQAYREFTRERSLPYRIEFGRIGVITKGASR